MIGLNVAELVAIIDHHSKGLAQSWHEIIAEKINRLNTHPIAEMKTREPIKQLIGLIKCQKQLSSCKPH